MKDVREANVKNLAMGPRALYAFLAACALSASLAAVSCSDDLPSDTSSTGSGGSSSSSAASSSSGAGGTDGGGMPDCFMNPKNHFEIINACTDAQKIDKTPVLPLLQADGGLPPLP